MKAETFSLRSQFEMEQHSTEGAMEFGAAQDMWWVFSYLKRPESRVETGKQDQICTSSPTPRDLLPPVRFHSLPKQCHSRVTKCSNTSL